MKKMKKNVRKSSIFEGERKIKNKTLNQMWIIKDLPEHYPTLFSFKKTIYYLLKDTFYYLGPDLLAEFDRGIRYINIFVNIHSSPHF